MITISCAESVTLGALSNLLASTVGASKFFYGSVIVYTAKAKKDILNVNIYEDHTSEEVVCDMCKAVALMFKTRIGMATCGFSLPTNDKPAFARIGLYDTLTKKFKSTLYEFKSSYETQHSARADAQVFFAFKGKELFEQVKLEIGTTEDDWDTL